MALASVAVIRTTPSVMATLSQRVRSCSARDLGSVWPGPGRARALLGQPARVGHVAHQQHGLCLDAQAANKADVPFGHADLGAVGGDPDNVHAVTDGPADVLTGAPPGAMNTAIRVFVASSRVSPLRRRLTSTSGRRHRSAWYRPLRFLHLPVPHAVVRGEAGPLNVVGQVVGPRSPPWTATPPGE